jgi:hypothetical protein
MAVLSNKFDILRGWPNASAVAEDFIIPGKASLGTHKFLQGQWVSLDASVVDGTMAAKTVLNTVNSGVSEKCYLIIEGRDDYSAQFANRVTCLVGGGYMVRLPETGKDSDNQDYQILSTAASNFAPGQAVKVVEGVLNPVADIDVDAPGNEVAEMNARALIVGHVMAVNTADNTIDIFVS